MLCGPGNQGRRPEGYQGGAALPLQPLSGPLLFLLPPLAPTIPTRKPLESSSSHMAAESRKLGSLGSRPGEQASLKALISGWTVYAVCALELARGLLLCRVSTPQ